MLISEVTDKPATIYKHRVFEQDELLLFTGSDNNHDDAWLIDLKQGTKNKIAAGLPFCQSLLFNSNGAFYITYYDVGPNAGTHTINFMKPDGSVFMSGSVNNYLLTKSRPYGAVICDERYYIIGNANGLSTIWECDGTDAGTKAIFSSANEITALQEWNGNLFFAAANTSQYVLYQYNHSSPGPIVFKTIPEADFTSKFTIAGQTADAFYFSSYDKIKKEFVLWQSDLTESGTFPFRENGDITVTRDISSINFYGDTFIISGQWGANTYTSYELYWGLKSNPASIWRIPYSQKIDRMNARIEKNFHNRYLFVNSVTTGLEMAYWADSVYLVSDLAPGSFSGIANFFNNSHVADQENIYLIASKNSAKRSYLYKSEQDSLRSLFKIPEGNLQEFFVHDGHAYLFYYSNDFDTLRLYKRDLSITDAPEQIVQKERKEEWHRQIFLYDNYSITADWSDGLAYPIKVHTDADENVITGFSMADYGPYSIQSSDTTALTSMKGGLFITKHNKYGELLWATSAGDPNPNYYFYRFTVDGKGDVVLFGVFYEKAVFDEDTLRASRAAFFVAKLDGKTGQTIWKKGFNSSLYRNSISPDGIVCDPDGNIYLALLYDEFNFFIDGHSLHADRSPANALVKLDTDGKTVWAQNILTPWTDYYGLTHGLVWDEHEKQVISVQCQGNYRTWSSCKFHDWGYYIQQVSADGKMKGTYEFKGDDLGAVGTVSINKLGYLYLSGFFRGKLETGSDVFYTAEADNCNKMENFNLLWSPSANFIRSSQASNGQFFFPYDAVSDENFMYVIGGEQSGGKQKLTIRKYDLFGKLLAKRGLNQFMDAFSFGYFYYLAIQNNHLVLMSYNLTDPSFPAIYVNNGIPYVSVIRMKKNEGWEEVYDYPAAAKEARVMAGPNPTFGPVGLTFLDGNTYTEVEIFDLKGASLFSTSVNGNYQNIDLSAYQDGLYLIRLTGPESQHTVKVVKSSR